MFLIILVLTSSGLIAQEQETTELSEFSISVETTFQNKIKLKCEEGCAWVELSFKLDDMEKNQAVDEFGMADTDKVNTNDENLSDFLFTMKRTENGLSLKGLRGTAWTALSFSVMPYKPLAISEMGMSR